MHRYSKNNVPRRAVRVLAVFCLLLGLAAGCRRTGREPAAAAAPAQTETGRESAGESGSARPEDPGQTREEFESLCGQFMREQLSGSFLNLHYTLLDPEAYGITGYERSFGDFSPESMRAERQKQKEFQAAFARLDPELLTPEQNLTHRVLTAAFEAEEMGDGLELYFEPLVPSSGIQAQLPVLLGEFSFRNRQDIEDYLTLLGHIEEYFRQILDFEERRSRAGLFMTDRCADRIIEECSGYLLPADQNYMTDSFRQRLDAIEDAEGLTAREKADYLARNRALVENCFLPAYRLLTDGLRRLKGTGRNDLGLCGFPDGAAYCEYLVRSSIGPTWGSMEDLRDAMTKQLDADLTAMSAILNGHPEMAARAEAASFSLTDPEEILAHLRSRAEEDFPEFPDCRCTIKQVPEALSGSLNPAFFLVPPIDGYTDCVIYVNPGGASASQPLYTTLAHEGIPGHMYQNAYFLSRCESDLRKVLSFPGYSEGWAFYAENYSYTTDDGLAPELGRLLARNAAASLGIHALMDLNVNYFGWTRRQAGEFLEPYFDLSREEEARLADAMYDTVQSAPCSYLDYYAGYLEILRMRGRAMETLGDRFDLKKFHAFLLDTGPAPFTVIEEEFQSSFLEGF